MGTIKKRIIKINVNEWFIKKPINGFAGFAKLAPQYGQPLSSANTLSPQLKQFLFNFIGSNNAFSTINHFQYTDQ